jgi:hypothetical protein
MFKKLLMAACLVIIAIAAKADDDQKITSKVQKVIVFLNGAQVTRTAMVNVNAGTSQLVFGGLSPGVDVQSVQVHANGEFTILSVKHEMNFLDEQVKQKQVEDLMTRQKAIREKMEMQNDMIAVYLEEERMLSKNQVINGRNSSLEIVKLKQALDFQTERLSYLKGKQQTIKEQNEALNLELLKYNRQIADIKKTGSTATSNVLVTVSSKAALQSTFTLSYVVHNASWFPTYDIRAKNVNSPVTITYKANVSQQSGEDWKNVKLTLSTGNPTVSGNKPELSPYYLSLGMDYPEPANTVTSVNGSVTGNNNGQPLVGATISIKGTTISAVTDANGNYSLQLPPGQQSLMFSYVGFENQEIPVTGNVMNVSLGPVSNALNEVVATGYATQRKADVLYSTQKVLIAAPARVNTIPIAVSQAENQTNFEFNIDNPYSIPSDGKQYLVEINQVDVKATYQYFVAPKISTDVFLTAQITDWNKYNFLSGEANLFFEGTYIGKSLIDTHAVNDTLNLSLGTDKNIVVTRTLQKELSEKQIFGSNKKETRNWLIDLKNRKNQPVNLLVEDQVPVSQNSSIEVEWQETSGVKPDALTGKVSWNFLLNSQDDKKVQLKYQVKYPKNQTVIVQ